MNETERLSDAEVVKRFLERTSRLSDVERAKAAGVTHTTIARWRARVDAGEDPILHRKTRRKVEDYLARARTEEQSEQLPVGSSLPPEASTVSDDLSRQIDEVNRLDVDEWVKAWKIGEIAAAYRSRALADNTAALRIAEEAALERARAAILNGKAMVVEGEAAAARLRGRDSGEKAYPPAQVAQVVPAPTPEERRRMEEEAKKKSA